MATLRRSGRCWPDGAWTCNAAAADGATALHWAVQRDDVDMTDDCCRAGANVRVTNRYGVTPLSLAAVNGNAANRRAAAEGGRRSQRLVAGRRDGVDERGAQRSGTTRFARSSHTARTSNARDSASRADGAHVGGGAKQRRCRAGARGRRRRSARAHDQSGAGSARQTRRASGVAGARHQLRGRPVALFERRRRPGSRAFMFAVRVGQHRDRPGAARRRRRRQRHAVGRHVAR